MSVKNTPDSYIPVVTVDGRNNVGPLSPTVSLKKWNNVRVAQTGPSDWRYRIRNGLDATTSLYGNKFSVKGGNGYWYQHQKADPTKGCTAVGDVIGGYVSDYFLPTGAATSQATVNALRKFNQKVQDSRKSFETGVFLGELLEAVRFVRNPLRSLQNESWKFVGKMGRLKRVYRRNPYDYQKAMTDTYLAYRYAAVPLSNDISNACVSLENISYGRRARTRFKAVGGSMHAYTTIRQSSYGLVAGTPNPVIFYVTDVEECTVEFRGGMLATPLGTTTPAEELGLTLGDVIPTAWELIPFSFVVDYLTNVGDFLQSFKTMAIEFSYLNRTVRNSRTRTVSDLLPPAQDAGYQPIIAYGGQASAVSSNVSRERITVTDLIPSLRFQLPGKWQMVNMGALALGFAHTKPDFGRLGWGK